MCGDSTKEEDVSKLMNGEICDITVTSPPYGAENTANLRNHFEKGKKIKKIDSFYLSHKDESSEWSLLIEKFFNVAQKFSKCQFINIQMLANNKILLIDWIYENSEKLVDILIWKKNICPPQMASNVLNNQFEFIFVFDNENNSRTIRFGSFRGNISNVIETKREKNEYAEIHKAVFPIEFPTKILNINKLAKTIFDPFGGTGTTLIACEQLDRQCYMMELDPAYCDVIVDRWEKFTGKKAEKING